MNFDELPNQDHYLRLWSLQLLQEFEDICWAHNVPLSPPAIEISEAIKTYGSWQADSKTIKISAQLIINHSWPVTINVLKHEMAHQICSEIWQSREVAHGVDFLQACHMLGVPEEFRSASGDLPDMVDAPAIKASDHRLLKKIEKLLALAASANEHEAALAMTKANHILAKYNLNQVTNKDRQYSYAVINRRRKRIEGWQRHICLILRDFFFVQTILSKIYEPLSDQTFKTIEIMGLAENVEVAEYCYHFLEQKLTSLWQQNYQQFKGNTRTEKNSFYLGLLQGFYDKLKDTENSKKQKEQHQPDVPRKGNALQPTSALITKQDKGLNKFIGQRYPRLRTIKRIGPKIYKDTYEKGKKEGKKIVLHKSVCQKGQSNNLPLGV